MDEGSKIGLSYFFDARRVSWAEYSCRGGFLLGQCVKGAPKVDERSWAVNCNLYV